MATSVVLAASTVCAPLVDGPRRWLLPLHRNASAIQYGDADGRVALCVMKPGAIRLPHVMVVRSLPVGSPPFSVGDGFVGWGSRRDRVARWFAPARPALPALRADLDPASVQRFARTWSAGLGRGPGLTPYADDVLCGSLVLLHAAGHRDLAPVADEVQRTDLERRTTATSAALVRLAAQGYCVDALADWLAALGSDAQSRSAAAQRLLAVGHTSGAGLMEGVRRLLRTPSHRAGAAA